MPIAFARPHCLLGRRIARPGPRGARRGDGRGGRGALRGAGRLFGKAGGAAGPRALVLWQRRSAGVWDLQEELQGRLLAPF
eukprot:9099164-Pyramimonas_sp.AAC.1